MARDNINLGTFNLEGIPPAPRGVPQIEVTFDIDANGILNVSAKDKGTGKTQKITITAPNKLSKDQIEKMMQAAKENEEIDKKRKELIELKNETSSLAYSLEKTMNDFKDKISEDEAKEIQDIVKKVDEDTKKEDASEDDIKADKDKLTEIINRISQKIYQQPPPDQGQQDDKTDGSNQS
jgi:molecular chaperone DnaK